ncbi:NUDIX domain-containing protein [Micromonospora marina]|uniref:NUDIX domain-containing protein n=1 Tax=Micromonospora marina TaxID=307120 RepID=UPI000B8773EE|nr:NUDIX hydrolase [Micromonospora marina]
MTANEMPPTATPRVAAGALFFDNEGRVLLVRPTYKEHWDIPGGYVEPGESPRAACIREIEEELGLKVDIGSMLVVDWAPAEREGDKILFVFDGGLLGPSKLREVQFEDGELDECRLVVIDEVGQLVLPRLARRIQVAVEARSARQGVYAEHGNALG